MCFENRREMSVFRLCGRIVFGFLLKEFIFIIDRGQMYGRLTHHFVNACFMSYELLNDELLLKLLKTSDEKAFQEIYVRYWKQIYLNALKKLRSADLAEELTQSLFVSLWEKREQNSIDNLPAYLNTAVRYKVINYIESRYSRQWNLQKDLSEALADDATDHSILLDDLNAAIYRAIELLPAKTQEVFKLSRFDRYSVREIAMQMNLSEKAVEYHITQSLKHMRLHLKEYMFFSLVISVLHIP